MFLVSFFFFFFFYGKQMDVLLFKLIYFEKKCKNVKLTIKI